MIRLNCWLITTSEFLVQTSAREIHLTIDPSRFQLCRRGSFWLLEDVLELGQVNHGRWLYQPSDPSTLDVFPRKLYRLERLFGNEHIPLQECLPIHGIRI